MKTTTTTCLAVLLLAVLATARLGDALPTTTDNSTNTTSLSAADINSFLSGVWEAIGLGREFEDFSTCIPDNANAGIQLQKAMTLVNSSSASDVTKGLNKLDKVVSPLVAGLKACNMKDKYTSTINKIVNNFTNPVNLTIKAGSSILINGIEVYPQVAAALIAYNASSFATSGTKMGEAMGKSFYSQQNATSAAQAAQINSIADNTWTAADSSEFNVMTVWAFKKKRLGLRHKMITDDNTAEELDSDRRNLQTVPAAFDSRTQWPGCIHAIRDQGGCGSCWAFAASEALSDRFCIVSNKSTNVVMSPQYLVSCDTTDWGCSGGYLYYAWKFLEKSGDVSDTCLPYSSGNWNVAACSSFTKCADGSKMRKYYAKVNSTRSFTTPASIQAEIIKNGPVETGMDVYSDFMSYKSGIYSNTAGSSYMGGHAIKIVGWGKSNNTNYWIVANSWGTYWGEAGFFRIKFGSCNIDSAACAGLPDLTRS